MASLQFFAVVLGALIFAGFGLKLNLGPFSTKQKLRLWAGLLLGAGLCFGVGGGASRYRTSHSARPEVEGVVSNLRIIRGNHGTKSTRFDVTSQDGKVVSISGNYFGRHVRDGQRIAVTYLEDYGGSLLKIKSLEAVDEGWSAKEGDGFFNDRLCCWIGVLATLIALILLLIANRASNKIDD